MSPIRTRRWSPPGRRGWMAALAATAIMAVLTASLAFAVHDDDRFELDRNATGDLNVTPVGYLTANIAVGATSINVCMTAAGSQLDPIPVQDDVILIRAERMQITSVASGTFGGNCGGTKMVYSVSRGFDGTTARAQAGGANNVGAAISLVKSATKAGPDWSQVFTSVTADANDTGADDKCIALGLVECTYLYDGIGPSIFIGGNSKDHLPISGWQHTTGSSPDKGEILNAYAAKAVGGDGNQLLYFGMDRYAVDGSTDIGFWFFKEQVIANANGTFTGNQSVGDILALGTFTQGGATTNIRVFEWVGSGGNESGTIEGPNGTYGDCVPGEANDMGCATVNNTTIEVPWTYQFKGESVGKWVPLGGFFEGGIDLTANGLDGCYSSFLAETRSSPEITAVLKDFALGSFEACQTAVTTTPGNGTAGTGNEALTDSDDTDTLVETSIGTGSVQVRDRATVGVTGVSTWSGTLDFYLCKLDGVEDLCDASTTAKTGTKIGDTIAINQGTAQPVLSAAATITSEGRYCWRGVFTSGTQGVPNGSDSEINECFEVNPVTPLISTSATTVVEKGSAISDTATLAGTATRPGTPIINPTTAGGNAGGTITFKLYGPNDADCSGTAVTVGTATVNGNGTNYGSGTYTPAAAGTYRWIASYGGDTPNTLAASGACNDAGETTKVVDAKISVTPLTATNEVNDAHTITATVQQDKGDGNGFVAAPNGTTVTFSLLNNTNSAAFVGAVNTCTTTSGSCSVQINTGSTGSVDIRATTTFSVEGLSLTRTTGSGGNNSADANKIYVDAAIAISPLTATNNVGEEHVFTITATGLPAAEIDSFDSITPSISPTPDSYSTTCGTPDTSVPGTATCTVTINSPSAGTFTLNATAQVTIAGLQVTRDTLSSTGSIPAGPGGTGAATKTYVAGTLAWIKWDQDDELLAGATFEVCQTHAIVTTGATPALVALEDPACQSVTDDVATDDDPDVVPDADNDGGEFLLQGLSLGTWTIRETAAPAGYAFDDELTQTVQLTFDDTSGSAAAPFVNERLYKMIIFVCNQSLEELEASDVTLAGHDPSITWATVPEVLADKGVTEADLCGIMDGAVYGDLAQGTYTPSVTIPAAIQPQ